MMFFALISLLLLFIISCGSSETKNKYFVYINPSAVVDTPEGTFFKEVEVLYRLLDDNSSLCDIAVSYSIDDGVTFQPATYKSGDGLTGLTSSPFPGTIHSFVWDTVADGIVYETCQIKIVPYGPGGNPGQEDITGFFVVENQGLPIISWLARAEGIVPYTDLTFYWQLDTPAVEISSYYYEIDNGGLIDVGLSTYTTINHLSFGLGTHTFRVWANSSMGRESDPLETVFTFDSGGSKLAPVIRIISGPEGTISNSTATFEYEAYDVDGSVQGYFVSVDESPPLTATVDTSWTTPALANGIHTFYVMAVDNEGKYSAILTRQFEVTGQ
jgi:hypothetical protein